MEETTAGQQTQDASTGVSTILAAGEAGHGWVAPDGAHWGTTLLMEQAPLKIVNDVWARQRALEHREQPTPKRRAPGRAPRGDRSLQPHAI
jgi:hypothetical protein